MGRELALAMPEVCEALDAEVEHLAGHLQPRWVAPRRWSWEDGWEEDALRTLDANPERVIVAAVASGILVHDAVRRLGVRPAAYLGYSLGESTALLASRAWRGRDELFRRTLASSLFRTDLAGPMSVLRRAWGADADWKVVVVNRPAEAVRAALEGNVALLIVNAPRECVVGGTIADVDRVVETLGCHALELASVPTVHLPLVEAVRQAYVELHLLPTTPPPCGARIYSGVWGRAYEPDEAKAAASITEGALRGFDFPAVVRQAYDDGVRVFLELGPRSSCSRMIDRILGDRPHL
jgi:acyl transferase domain-containing protein